MNIKNVFTKVKLFAVTYKVWTGVIVLVLIFGSWQIYKSITSTTGDVRYITSNASLGNIVSSVSASGQVEATSQVDLKARTSGQITYIGVKPGDTVRKGKTLFGLNAKDAQKSVRNAETSLESAKLDLEKLKRVPDTVDVLEIKQAIKNTEQTKVDAQKDVDKAFRDLLNTSTVATSSVLGSTQSTPTITGTYTKNQEVVINISVYQTGGGAYFNVSTTPSGVINANGIVSTTIAQPVGDSGLYIKFATAGEQPAWIINLPNKSVALYETNNKAYQDALSDQKTTNETADLTVLQKNQALDDLYQPDEFELRAKELAVRQAEDNLQSAKADLSDYYVFAPFDGIMASVDAKIGETTSASLGSIITNQKLATLTLNEVDVAKIKIGQKANVTFDAIEDLSIGGEVVEIDTLGTVTSGVVSYEVKIALDTEDIRVKPGMSVSASIVTDSKADVLVVPASAVKSKNDFSYVEVFSPKLPDPIRGEIGVNSKTLPTQIKVETGLTDDVSIEIVSGLKEGDQIVSRTVTGTSKGAAPTPSLFSAPSANRSR